jgi:inosine-uridine nucleoside N-ribohydrolase
MKQQALHALRFLELGNLTSIPVVEGSEWPLVNTYERMQSWQELYGKLAWSGGTIRSRLSSQRLHSAFNPENRTAEELGADPSGPDVTRTVAAAIPEGLPTTLPLQGVDASLFMIEMVHKYPGQVDVFAAGALTNIAIAIILNSTFAENVKSLVIQGGYLDVNVRQVFASSVLLLISRRLSLWIYLLISISFSTRKPLLLYSEPLSSPSQLLGKSF